MTTPDASMPTPEYPCCDHCSDPMREEKVHRHLIPCTVCGQTAEHDAEHDDLCEIEREPRGYGTCLCAARAEGIDPRLLKMRVKRVRQAETALATVKHTLASYISEHVPNRCQYATGGDPCPSEVDGFILVSCGHHLFTCSRHGSRALRDAHRPHLSTITCVRLLPPLHEKPAAGVSIEWVGL